MRYDTGFAPNPYHDVLTLATCKPTIRRCAKEGYWISGWTSNAVYDKNNNKHEFTDDTQRLIYLAKVSNNPKIEDYWKQYPQKQQPDQSKKMKKNNNCGNILSEETDIRYFGDNIYEPDANEPFGFKQHKNAHHGEQDKKRDLSGKNVLVCKEFYYFGVENPLKIEDKGFVVPRCKKIPLDAEEAKKVIDYVKINCSKALYYKKNENHFK